MQTRHFTRRTISFQRSGTTFAGTWLSGSVLAARDLSLVEPGDILILEFVHLKEMFGHAVTKVVHVTSEGAIVLPSIEGIKPSSLNVGGLSMVEISEQLQKDYAGPRGQDRRYWFRQVVVERGTAVQLRGR